MSCENLDCVLELCGVLGCSGGEQDVMVVGSRRGVFFPCRRSCLPAAIPAGLAAVIARPAAVVLALVRCNRVT